MKILAKKKIELSNTVKTITWIVLFIFVFIGLGSPIWGLIDNNDIFERYILISILCILFISSIPVFIYLPKKIIVTETDLILRRGLGSLYIPFKEIEEIYLYDPGNIVDIRVFGIGGVGGFIGKYYNKKIGNYTSYVGNYSQAFYVKTKVGKKYVFSCKDAEIVISLVKTKIAIDK